jgi:hypothetical protein
VKTWQVYYNDDKFDKDRFAVFSKKKDMEKFVEEIKPFNIHYICFGNIVGRQLSSYHNKVIIEFEKAIIYPGRKFIVDFIEETEQEGL